MEGAPRLLFGLDAHQESSLVDGHKTGRRREKSVGLNLKLLNLLLKKGQEQKIEKETCNSISSLN